MRENLTIGNVVDLINYIKEHHRLIEGRGVKYIDFTIDFRTMDIWRICIRPFCAKEKVFTTTNRSEGHVNLKEEIKKWLHEGEEKNEKGI